MIRRLQKRYALSEQGAKDLIKGCFACVLQNISFMFPVGLLYCMVSDLMNGGVPESRLPFYIVGCILCVGLILLTTYFQYNATGLHLFRAELFPLYPGACRIHHLYGFDCRQPVLL